MFNLAVVVKVLLVLVLVRMRIRSVGVNWFIVGDRTDGVDGRQSDRAIGERGLERGGAV